MTIVVNANDGIERIHLNNVPITPIPTGTLQLISQYSKETESFEMTKFEQNDRYSTYLVNFGAGFNERHANGIYWAKTIIPGFYQSSWFLVKLITSPGGESGISRYVADTPTEERQAEVFYRPNY